MNGKPIGIVAMTLLVQELIGNRNPRIDAGAQLLLAAYSKFDVVSLCQRRYHLHMLEPKTNRIQHRFNVYISFCQRTSLEYLPPFALPKLLFIDLLR